MSEDRSSQTQSEQDEINNTEDYPKEGIALEENNTQCRIKINYDEKIEELKNEVKALKILRKQQEKIEKLEEKKRNILREMEIREGHGKRRKEKRRKRKRD